MDYFPTLFLLASTGSAQNYTLVVVEQMFDNKTKLIFSFSFCFQTDS
jgi:hypothetical protein